MESYFRLLLFQFLQPIFNLLQIKTNSLGMCIELLLTKYTSILTSTRFIAI